MEIRKATPADFPEWLRLRRALWPDGTSHEAEIASLHGRTDAAVFLAELAPRGIVGFLEVGERPFANGCDTGPVAFVEGIWVDPPGRGKGVGRALVEAAEAWARERGHTELGSDTGIDNRTSLIAHRAWGFEERERVVYLRKKLP